MNQIYTINPFLKNSVWVFNDKSVGLKEEPFVSGIPQIIKYYVKSKRKFNLIFSKSEFPEWNVKLKRVKLEFGGAWYKDENTGLQGWLCPALLKYFEKPPIKIFCKINY